MDIAEKILQSKQDFDDVYEAGQKSEYDRFWDNFQENGNRVTYFGAFSGVCWTQETLKPKYKIAPNDGTSTTLRYGAEMFWRCNRSGKTRLDFSQIADKFDFSKCNVLTSLFAASSVDNIYVDMSGASNGNSMFSLSDSGLGAISITLKVSDKTTSMGSAFYGNKNLENLIFTDDSVLGCPLDLSWSTKLTHGSLMSVINALKDYSENTSGIAHKLILGSTNLDKLTDEEKAIATEKGWTLA